MVNILFLVGSPRKNGNSSIMSDRVIQELPKEKFNTEKHFLYDYDIKPCIDCRGCKKNDLECVLDDGMKELYPKIENADMLVVATPIYWFGPTAQTKLMLDRLRPHYVNKKLSGKRAVLLLPAGSGDGDCDLTIEMFKRSFEALEINYTGAVTAEAYDRGDVENNKEALKKLIELSGKIIK